MKRLFSPNLTIQQPPWKTDSLDKGATSGPAALQAPKLAANQKSCSAVRLEQQQAAEQVARKLNEFERKAHQLAGLGAPSGGGQTNWNSLKSGHQMALQTAKSSQASSKAADKEERPSDRLAQKQPTGGDQRAASGQQTGQTAGSLSDKFAENFRVASWPSGRGGQSTATVTGRLFVALKFAAESHDLLARRSAHMEGSLRVMVKEAVGLGGGPSGGASPSAQCKCYLLAASGQRLAKLKSQLVKRNSNPRWDQELSFGAQRLAQLAGQALEIHVINRDHQPLGGELALQPGPPAGHLGGIRLCQAAAPEASEAVASERESRLWAQMLERPNIWVYGELPLRVLRPLAARRPSAKD